VGIGITDDDGNVLLIDGLYGWSLPYAEVEPDEDWAAIIRRGVEKMRSRTIEVLLT